MQECAVRAEHKALLATADTSRCISVSYFIRKSGFR